MKKLLKGGSVVSGAGIKRADVLIDGEKIARIGRKLEADSDTQVTDVTGCLLFPGFIDAHTHFDLDVCNTTTAAPTRGRPSTTAWSCGTKRPTERPSATTVST